MLVSTAALAKAVQQLSLPVWVCLNGFGDLSWAIARHVRRQPRATQEGVLIGYASGTPTHAADFAVVAPTLARVLEAYPGANLRVLGASIWINIRPCIGIGIGLIVCLFSAPCSPALGAVQHQHRSPADGEPFLPGQK